MGTKTDPRRRTISTARCGRIDQQIARAEKAVPGWLASSAHTQPKSGLDIGNGNYPDIDAGARLA